MTTNPHSTDRLTPEELAYYQAARNLLTQADFRGQFLPTLERDERMALMNLPDDAPEMTLRRQFIRWKMALRVEENMAALVKEVEARMDKGNNPAPAGATL